MKTIISTIFAFIIFQFAISQDIQEKPSREDKIYGLSKIWQELNHSGLEFQSGLVSLA